MNLYSPKQQHGKPYLPETGKTQFSFKVHWQLSANTVTARTVSKLRFCMNTPNQVNSKLIFNDWVIFDVFFILGTPGNFLLMANKHQPLTGLFTDQSRNLWQLLGTATIILVRIHFSKCKMQDILYEVQNVSPNHHFSCCPKVLNPFQDTFCRVRFKGIKVWS
jgi:hypothetical protein